MEFLVLYCKIWKVVKSGVQACNIFLGFFSVFGHSLVTPITQKLDRYYFRTIPENHSNLDMPKSTPRESDSQHVGSISKNVRSKPNEQLENERDTVKRSNSINTTGI